MQKRLTRNTNEHLTIKTMTVPNRHLDLINGELIIIISTVSLSATDSECYPMIAEGQE